MYYIFEFDIPVCCLADDELPDYIMVMVANKKNQGQMTEDLNLFLGTNTNVFTEWYVHHTYRAQSSYIDDSQTYVFS